MKKLCFATLLAIVAVSCVQPTAQTSAEIQAHSDQWEAALQAGDIETLASLYAEDCRVLPPNAEMQTGRAAAEAAFGEMIDAGLTGELTTVEALVVGDLGYNLGTYALQSPDGAEVDRGKFIEIWRRVDGEWKISNDIWNSDLPAAPAGQQLMITHEVGDPEIWLAAWRGPESRHQLFADHGAPSVGVFQSSENPNLTGLLVDVTDREAFESMLASPEGQAAAAEDTVDFDTIQTLVGVE